MPVLPPSPLRKFAPLADRALARGTRVHFLNLGQPDFPLPPEVREKMSEIAAGLEFLPYTDSRGLPETRAAWSEFFAREGIDFSPDEILITTGGSEALTLALAVAARPGRDEVLTFEPGYANYFSFAAQTGARLVPVPLSIRHGFHFDRETPGDSPDPARAEKKLSRRVGPRTAAILLSNPSNPTGTVFSEAELEAIARVAARHDLVVIADEVYREFVFDGAASRSLASFPEIADRLILIDSISKRFAACGMRVGALATKNPALRDEILRACQARLSVATLEQKLAAPLLRAGGDFTARLRAELGHRRDAFLAALEKFAPEISASRPEGAFYLLLKIPGVDTEKFAEFLIRDFADRGETVLLAPARGFYLSPDRGADQARIALVEPAADLRRAAEILGAGLRAFLGK